jgi:hypothetical protein
MRHGVFASALAAWLPPLAVANEAPAVESLVFERTNQDKVFDSVVELVAVSMMNLEPGWDWPGVPFPNKNVLHAVASLHGAPDTSITLGGDCAVSTRSRAFWSSFSHDEHCNVTISILSSPEFLSCRLAFAQ